MTEAATRRPHVLLLPGMTLNETIFPDLPFPTSCIEFNDAPPPAVHSDPMRRYVLELDRRLAAAPGWKSATARIVVAHSFGGMLVLEWLLGSSGGAMVDGLVLVATTAGPMFDMVKIRLARFGDRDFRISVNQLMPIWNRPLVTKTVKRALTSGTLDVEQVDFQQLPNPTDLRVDFAGWRNTDWQAMRSYRDAMSGYDVRDRLDRITVPTIVVHGSEDALFEPHVGEALAQSLPNAEFRLVQGARHALPLTHGADVVRAVMALAKRLGE